ncbi:MAG: hypothetical protein IPO07_04775 [Haliscomenobacter sp.]|nr:hypothetical protein [Haliscomenobacter sp.]MBK9488176.1 hypothetical protein [Haliscomenobacter sp.]
MRHQSAGRGGKNFKLNKNENRAGPTTATQSEIKNVNKKYNRIFDEFELFPFLKDDDDDDDDDDDNPANVGNGFQDLNDAPYAIDLAWRSSTSVDFDYKIRKWLRFGQSYSLLLDAEDVRHLARTDLTFQPQLPGKKLDLQFRIAHQLGASHDKGRLELDSDFSGRTALEWEFKKRHVWFNNFSVNGAFDEKSGNGIVSVTIRVWNTNFPKHILLPLATVYSKGSIARKTQFLMA